MFPPQSIGDWWFAAPGMELPEDEVGPPLEPECASDEVEALIGSLRSRGDGHRWQLALLRQSVEHGRVDALSTAALHDWLRRAVGQGRVVMQAARHEVLDTAGLDVDGVLRAVREWQALERQAREDGFHVPAPSLPLPLKAPVKGHMGYEGVSPTAANPDAFDETCPRDNFRSESMLTASSDVKRWLLEHLAPGEDPDKVLGAAGGGGFRAGCARLIQLKKGMRLVRYYGDEAGAGGRWWSLYPCAGDPRAASALPPGNNAEAMSVCMLDQDMVGIIGLGAPRCSNKPGGPPQIFLALKRPVRTVTLLESHV